MILTLDLVPSTATSNLRQMLGATWSEVSKIIRSKANYTCQLCGNKGQNIICYHTHEVWEYNTQTGIQRLAGFQCLCKTCHAVRHWGRSQITGQNMKKLLDHTLKVNKCSLGAWKKHLLESKLEWDERSKHTWELSWTHWRELL